MRIEEKIKNHLAAYKMQHGKTQKEMADIIGVSYTTYQALEKGIVKTLDVLNKLKNTTGFNEKNVYNTGFAGEEIVKLQKEIIKLNAALNVLLPMVSKLSAKDENVTLETRRIDILKVIDAEYDRLYMKYLKEQEEQ